MSLALHQVWWLRTPSLNQNYLYQSWCPPPHRSLLVLVPAPCSCPLLSEHNHEGRGVTVIPLHEGGDVPCRFPVLSLHDLHLFKYSVQTGDYCRWCELSWQCIFVGVQALHSISSHRLLLDKINNLASSLLSLLFVKKRGLVSLIYKQTLPQSL